VETPLGRFAVLGNHDLWADDVPIIKRLSAAGIEVLINESRPLPPPYQHVSLCGLDDPTSGQPDVAAALGGADGIRIVLMHSPEGLELLGGQHFKLAL
jgi:predicted MPP superfamily phosphohydrolase